MDEFEKVNETLENEETKTESEAVELSEDNEPINTAEAEVEESAAEISEQTDSAEESAENTEEAADSVPVADGVSELALDTDETTAAVESKKPFILQRTIITAACIFLAALLVFGIFVVVNYITTPSLDGVWVMTKTYTQGDEKNAQTTKTTGKEAVYYDFKSNGNFVYTSGTIKQTLKWSYVDSKNKKSAEKTDTISIYPEGGEANGKDYKIDLEGGLFAEKKLKIEMSADMGMGAVTTQIMELIPYGGSDAPVYKMEADKNFKPVNDLLGTWNDKTTEQKITFNKDGSYVLDVSGNLEQSGNYKVDTKKSTVTLSYVGNGAESDTGALPYKLKDGKLTLATYTFEKVK